MVKTQYSPWDQSLVPKLEERAEALEGTFNAQKVANTLCVHATMGRAPGAGLMRELEGRACSLKAQEVVNTLLAHAMEARSTRRTWKTRCERRRRWGGSLGRAS